MNKSGLSILISTLAIFLAVSCNSARNDFNNVEADLSLENRYSVENAFPHLSFHIPTDIQNADDGSNRLFIVNQPGFINVVSDIPQSKPEDGQSDSPHAKSAVFLDIRDRVAANGIEMGMLGLAFHPDYKDNGYFYVHYMADNPRRNVISRFSVSSSDNNKADPDSELVLLEVEQPKPIHNGGQLVFGPEDGYLYITIGEGGPIGKTELRKLDLKNLLGTIVRIDVDNPQNPLKYGIPPDNPLVNNRLGRRKEIYAFGFRNPWRISFDSKTGALWAGDVGQATLEEIDIVEKGRNYGWPVMEGSICCDPPRFCNILDILDIELPVWEYGRDLGEAIIGGYVYRGNQLPKLEGKYIYGDFKSGRIWALGFEGHKATSNTQLFWPGDGIYFFITSFGIDEQNELYLATFDGRIYRLVRKEVL